MRPASFLVGLTAALALTAPHAERADREKEIVLLADKGTADDSKKVSVFEGNVVITQGTMRITASKVTLTEKDNFKYYVASGSPVTFRQKRDKADDWFEGFAERAEFDDRNDVLKLFNKAKVKSAANEITGEFITYDMRRELAEVTGGPPGQQVSPEKRVKVIIVPQKGANAPGKADPKEGVQLKSEKDVK